jgi:hypothetical protein
MLSPGKTVTNFCRSIFSMRMWLWRPDITSYELSAIFKEKHTNGNFSSLKGEYRRAFEKLKIL